MQYPSCGNHELSFNSNNLSEHPDIFQTFAHVLSIFMVSTPS